MSPYLKLFAFMAGIGTIFNRYFMQGNEQAQAWKWLKRAWYVLIALVFAEQAHKIKFIADRVDPIITTVQDNIEQWMWEFGQLWEEKTGAIRLFVEAQLAKLRRNSQASI